VGAVRVVGRVKVRLRMVIRRRMTMSMVASELLTG
jgi:hypothetical protein